TLAESPAAQIVQSIRMQVAQGVGEATIQLSPRYFGDLSVSVRVEDGEVVARLQASQAGVREWLHANQSSLRQGLAEHNLTLTRLEVTDQPAESRDSRPSDGQQPQGGRRPRQQPRKPTDATFEQAQRSSTESR
ncbi:MAG: flagellar hook-length control protein FliK, partial [Acidobacteriota bacterium]